MNFRERKRREPQLIIVSLIDVVLQLVIFLLLTTTFEGREVSFAIDLPEAETGVAGQPSMLTVDVGPEGKTTVGGELIGEEELVRLFSGGSKDLRSGGVTIRADRETAHGDVVKVVDLARKSELDRLNIAVAPGMEAGTEPAGSGRRAGESSVSDGSIR